MKKETKAKRPPTHVIWAVIGETPKARWMKIGAGWTNKDGKGINLVFDAYPVAGRIAVREITEAEGADAPGGQQ